MTLVKLDDGTTWPIVDDSLICDAMHSQGKLTKERIQYLGLIAESYDMLTRPGGFSNVQASSKLRAIRSTLKKMKEGK